MKAAKEKPPRKEKPLKKGKAAKPHPSSKAGPGFSLRAFPENQQKIEIFGVNKKGPSYSAGVRDGDFLVAVNGRAAAEISLNDVKSMLVAPCGTRVPVTIERIPEQGEEPQTVDVELILDFSPLVKTLVGGKPVTRGEAAELSLSLVDSDRKRELFVLAGALPALCKLVSDPKAAAQVGQAVASEY
jgi:hypothetical protein